MKRTEKFKEIFGNMRVRVKEKPKEWRVTTSRIIHKDKKKEANKKTCRQTIKMEDY